MELGLLQRGLLLVNVWLVLAAISCCSGRATVESVPTSGVYAEQWRGWKSSAGKSYLSTEEEALRYTVWKDNLDFIDGHNTEADKHGFTLKMNSFGDMVGNTRGRYSWYREHMQWCRISQSTSLLWC